MLFKDSGNPLPSRLFVAPFRSLRILALPLTMLVATNFAVVPLASAQRWNRSSRGSSGKSTTTKTPTTTTPVTTTPVNTTPVTTTPVTTTPVTTTPATTSFTLNGLVSPATVAESIFVSSTGLASTASVSYFVDDVLRTTEKASPFWMGGQTASSPNGFSVAGLSVGSHNLRASATLADGSRADSNVVSLNVVPSINSQLSATLTPYANQLTAQQAGLSTILASVTTPGAAVTSNEVAARQAILTMYMNWGINPSLDSKSDISSVLAALKPKTWQAPSAPVSANTILSMAFSPDAPYYHAIPALWPKVALPSGYMQQLQLNAAYGGDGIGYGQTIAASTDPQLTVTSQWYSDKSTLRQFPYRMKSDWKTSLPTLPAGDSHVIFTDPTTGTYVSTYKTTYNQSTGGPNALYASPPTSFNSLGDAGGSNAAQFAELPVMVQPGEATNPTKPIPHAIGGPVGRTWGARVYPAIARDDGMMTSTNPCNGTGYTNTGLVPYGGVIQLDPKLDLTTLSLSLPALRILQAMQTYGYYVMDFGCGDMDIYTAVSETEFEPYGGMYGNNKGPGVQNEVQRVIISNNLYVVAPLIKKQ